MTDGLFSATLVSYSLSSNTVSVKDLRLDFFNAVTKRVRDTVDSFLDERNPGRRNYDVFPPPPSFEYIPDTDFLWIPQEYVSEHDRFGVDPARSRAVENLMIPVEVNW